MTASPFILLNGDDNVLVCREAAPAGLSIILDGAELILPAAINVGHKIARRDLQAGDKIYKYGAPIGSMTTDVARGGHVHMHNMKSDYISSHTREATGHA